MNLAQTFDLGINIVRVICASGRDGTNAEPVSGQNNILRITGFVYIGLHISPALMELRNIFSNLVAIQVPWEMRVDHNDTVWYSSISVRHSYLLLI